MEITIRTPKARQTHRRPQVVGYLWKGDQEFEMLSCGHARLVEVPFDVSIEEDLEEYEWLVELPTRRVCEQCPVPHKGFH